MEKLGVKNELGFVWFGGVVYFFSSHNLAIRPSN